MDSPPRDGTDSPSGELATGTSQSSSPVGPRRRRNSRLFLEIPARSLEIPARRISYKGTDKVTKAVSFLRRNSRTSLDDETHASPVRPRSPSRGGDGTPTSRAKTKDSAISTLTTSTISSTSVGLPEDQAMRAIQARYGRRLSIGATEGLSMASLDFVPWGDVVTQRSTRREAMLPFFEDNAEGAGDDATNVVTFFDWDDTLLPTTAVASERGWEGQPKDEEVEALTAHAKVVHECLLKASSAGYVAIVTLGKRPWVQVTCERYLLGVDWKTVFEELGIVVIYAQEALSKKKRMNAMLESGVNVWVASKSEAMAKALRRFRIGADDPLNVVGIGDSLIEAEAAQEIVWRRPWRGGRACCVKTLQLRDEPDTVEALTVQLQDLLPWFSRLYSHAADLRLSVDDLSKEDCPLRAAPGDPPEQASGQPRPAEPPPPPPGAERMQPRCTPRWCWRSLGLRLKRSQKDHA